MRCALRSDKEGIMLVELSVKDFMAEVASDSPAPGGGSVSAMAASAGAGLVAMLANLTKDKKGYEDVHAEMAEVAADCEKWSARFLAVIDEDTRAFEAYMEAIKMPKDSDNEKQIRSNAMQSAMKNATLVPMQLARNAFGLFEKAEYALKHGNKYALSDGAVGLLMLRSGILGALYNVRINIGSIKDEDFVHDIGQEAEKIEAEVLQAERDVLEKISFNG